MSKVNQWPDGSLHINKPFKRTVQAPRGLAFFIVRLKYWLHIYSKINIDIHYEGNRIIKVQPHLVFKKIGNGKLPKQ